MKSFTALFLALLFSFSLFAQRVREVETQEHFWWSMNSQPRLTQHWSLVGDVHIRRTNFLKNNSFYFVRLGALYHVTSQFSIAAGGGHLWLANRSAATELFSNENRLYQQLQLGQRLGSIRLLQRLRIEERWQQKVVNFVPVSEYRYSTRFRYLLSATIPFSKNEKLPAAVVANELLLQTGKDIVYNQFDQNRLFTGLRQQVTSSLAFDIGYMLVYQQRLSGYQYSRNHTFRWFFYWQPDFRSKKKTTTLVTSLPEEL